MDENEKPEQDIEVQKPVVMEPCTLEERLGFVFNSLVRRLDAFDSLEKRIGEIEQSIMSQPIPEDFNTKLDLYERFSKIHLAYIDTLRKVVGQLDMNSLTKAAGISALFIKFKDLPVESIKKIGVLLEKMKNGEEDDSDNEQQS